MANASIFRAYDIRGLYKKDFDENDSKLIAKAFASFLKPRIVVVGYDNRLSSASLKEFLVQGLLESGVDVIDVGMVPTPVLYYSIIKFRADGGIMVTASHLEKEYNGFKLCRENAIPLGESEIKDIKKIIDKLAFKKSSEGWGRYSRKNILDSYFKELEGKINLEENIKVAVDTGNGTGGPVIKKLLESLGIEAVYLFSEPDGDYPNHHPDPTVEEILTPLKNAIVENKCDLGIGIDGDADRVVFLDETGGVLRGDQSLAIFSERALADNKGKKILFEVKCSRLLAEHIERQSGIPIMGRTGHSFIKQRMNNDSDIIVAGEMSGHFFFREFHSIDDSFFASLKMIETLSKSGKKMTQLVENLPKYFSTPEIKVGVPEEAKFGIVEQLKKDFVEMAKNADSGIEKVIDIDGVRVEFNDGWGLARASNTSPYIIMRFEAKTNERMEEIRKIFDSALKNRM